MLAEIQVSFDEFFSECPSGVVEDVRFSQSLAAAVITEFTSPGAMVFDPFAGYGTTLVAARRLGRHAMGVELMPARAAICRMRAGASAPVLVGDVRDRLADIRDPVDLCLTSPPYMTSTEHPENPLTGYRSEDGHYTIYLAELASIFRGIGQHLSGDRHLVVNVADQEAGGRHTPLVADIAAALSRHLQLVQKIPVHWDHSPAGITNDTCLVFTTP